MIKVGIIGATGYAGAELVRILINHPEAEIVAVGSKSFDGKKLSEVYPSLCGFCDAICEDNSLVVDKSEVIFACLPHGLSEEIAAQCDKKGKKFIDLGADFRLSDENDYREWYGLEYHCKNLHEKAVYGLPELFLEDIRGADIIANPGCYPTSAALGLFPAIEKDFVLTDNIVIDAKSGVTGAGRGLSQTTHYPDCNEAFSPYKVAMHRHTPEIEQTLSIAAKKPIKVTFVPHLLPVNRGIISTMYVKTAAGVTKQMMREAYEQKYSNCKFVRVLEDGNVANLKNVRYSNMCDISLHFDDRTGTFIVVSAIDNMVKGAAGQAVQNMNIIFGLDYETGLNMVPPAF
ncbi:MAG: N-acetyl-gamma-glutamyl-phosphate reductase [Oscillospiraceae bacterium]